MRCGFRDFRFENGYFRLNGRRLFLRSTHTCNHFPVGLKLPPDPDMARRDLLDLKAMGFNMIRFIWGGAERYQLDLCDEIGLMVYEESFASSAMQESPQQLAARWNQADHGTDPPRPQSSQRRHLGIAERDPGRCAIPPRGLVAAAVAATRRHAHGVPQQRPLGLAGGQRRRVCAAGHLARACRPGTVGHVESGGRIRSRRRLVSPGRRGKWRFIPDRRANTASCVGRRRPRIAMPWRPSFQGLANATTDVHVLHNGRPLFESRLNLQKQPQHGAPRERNWTMARGDTLDFVVGWGNGSYGSDSTALNATIKSGAGKTFDVAADFSGVKNPAGPWSYGFLAAGAETRCGDVHALL